MIWIEDFLHLQNLCEGTKHFTLMVILLLRIVRWLRPLDCQFIHQSDWMRFNENNTFLNLHLPNWWRNIFLFKAPTRLWVGIKNKRINRFSTKSLHVGWINSYLDCSGWWAVQDFFSIFVGMHLIWKKWKKTKTLQLTSKSHGI